MGQRHLGDLVEADGQRDGAEDEQAVVDGHPHQDDGLHGGGGHFDQEGADQVHCQEEEADEQEEQVERKSGGETRGRGLISGGGWSALFVGRRRSLPVLQQRR